ncbi:hypothetical protein [Flavobacterium sp. 5]|uniref:hypothetical protein n=1 Tax=Flavobacterium sp. 5 TaxID=2035199 RepID=UPI000C2CC08D|nr:hypothetical protein [Flavobacterium sp. 5]PKB16897.1 hypothetical protein CLU82_2050 [Flavobacterium sp. 5]
MEKNKINTEKNNSTKFAFLPEMVLEHLNDAKTITQEEIIKEEVPNPTTSQTIVFDPMADPFDGSIIEIKPTNKKKSKIKSIKAAKGPNLEAPKLIIVENKIMQLVKKIKFYFINF